MRPIKVNNKLSKQSGEPGLPAAITKAASKQTYYIIRFLVDRERAQDAYRAYAYFRWVDDQLDAKSGSNQEKIAFVNHQQALLEACYQKESPGVVSPEEQMLVDLVGNDHEKDSGLQFYLRGMMSVMAFDAERCGRVISYDELIEYSQLLSKAVTEALFYFIGHQDSDHCDEARYLAVNGAHLIHMLRDTVEDASTGFFNIPAEYIEAQHISFDDLGSLPVRKWVYGRVKLAREYFKVGRQYIAQVKNLRCRLAGFAYLARFELILNAIERDKYYLRPAYPERKSLRAGIWMCWRILTTLLNITWLNLVPREQAALTDLWEEG